MNPIFFEIGSLPVTWFGLMMVSAFSAGLLNWLWLGRREGKGADYCSDLLLWIMIGGILGARVAYVASDWDYFTQNPIRIVQIYQGGLIFYGGLIGGGVSLFLFSFMKREKLLALVDFVVTSLPLGHFFGRIGCFLNGCCYGSGTASIFGVCYPPGSPAAQGQVETELIARGANSLPLHPVQLYEAAANLLIYILLIWAYRRKKADGRILALYLTTYPIVRFCMEFFRGDERLHWSTRLTAAQNVSMALFALGVIIWIWSFVRTSKKEQGAA